MISIVIILLLLAGAYIVSPLSPLNKANVNGNTVKLPSGYTIENSTGNSLKITNSTNTLSIYPTKESTELEVATTKYIEQFSDKYNITSKPVKSDDSQEIIKTVAVSNNTTITKYWFKIDDTTYNIQTEDAVADTENIVKQLISSMN